MRQVPYRTILLAGLGVSTAPVFAQEATVAEERGLEEIVVTAQRREENLQKVPIAVSVATAATFARFASPDISDLTGSIPNLYIQPTPGGSSILSVSIRGIQYGENEKTFEPPVGVVLDGVFLGTAQGGLLETFDLERVEVLRGPQGTLFGKNTTGGVVNAIRTRPTGVFGAKLGVTYGSFNRREAKAVVNFPIVTDVLSGKVSFFYEKVDGVRNIVFPGRRNGNRNYWSATATLLFQPSDALELLLTYDHVKDRGESPPVYNIYQRTSTVLPTTPTTILRPDTPCAVLNLCPPRDFRNTRMEGSGIAHADVDAITANASWDISDNLKLVSVTGWRRASENLVNDFDATEILIFETRRPNDDFKQFSQELRLEGNIGDRVRFVAGVFYFDSNYKSDVTRFQDVGYIRGNPALIGVRNPFFPNAAFSSLVQIDHDAKSYAGFAQADLKITDAFTLSAGIRYTKDKKRMFYRLVNPDGTTIGLAQGARIPQIIDTNADWDKWTPRVALNYQVSDNFFTYASFTRGYNTGGYSGRAPDVSTVGPYDPETVDAYEIGFKSELLDRTLRLNVAAFRNNYKDKQEEVSSATTIPPFFGTAIANASSARIQGIEVEATAIPTDGLSVGVSFGYLDAKYNEFIANVTGLGVTDNSNLKLRRAPRFTLSPSIDYKFDVGRGTASAGARARFVDEIQLSVSNDPLGRVESVAFVDAALGYEFEAAGSAWQLNFYGRNLTDSIRQNAFFRAGSFLAFVSANRGREVGIDLTVKF